MRLSTLSLTCPTQGLGKRKIVLDDSDEEACSMTGLSTPHSTRTGSSPISTKPGVLSSRGKPRYLIVVTADRASLRPNKESACNRHFVGRRRGCGRGAHLFFLQKTFEVQEARSQDRFVPSFSSSNVCEIIATGTKYRSQSRKDDDDFIALSDSEPDDNSTASHRRSSSSCSSARSSRAESDDDEEDELVATKRSTKAKKAVSKEMSTKSGSNGAISTSTFLTAAEQRAQGKKNDKKSSEDPFFFLKDPKDVSPGRSFS